jgi:hypothetical protein
MRRTTVTRLIRLLAGVGFALVSLSQRPWQSPLGDEAAAQQVPPSGAPRFDASVEIKPIDRFDGRTTLRSSQAPGGQVELQAVLRNWIIPNRQRIERFPEPGFLMVQVRSGEDLVTVIDGQRQVRQVEEFFTVPVGSSMSIETGNDTVIIQTLAIRSP